MGIGIGIGVQFTVKDPQLNAPRTADSTVITADNVDITADDVII
jgi:hypothetical protein